MTQKDSTFSPLTGPAVMGSACTAVVDNVAAGQSTSVLFAFDIPASVTLATGQTVLCLGTGEMLTGIGLSPVGSSGGIDTFSIGVPNSPEFVGVQFHTQAIQFGNPPLVLTPYCAALRIGGALILTPYPYRFAAYGQVSWLAPSAWSLRGRGWPPAARAVARCLCGGLPLFLDSG